MSFRRRVLRGSVFFLLATFAASQATPPDQAQTQIGYKSAAGADEKKTLLLKEFSPASMLHARAHPVDRAKYYVIDVHNHVNDALGIDDHMPPAQVVDIMDKTNVKTVIILTGMWGDKLQHVIDEMVKPYPGRFMVFSQIDWSKIDDPIFSQEMVAQLDDAVRRGARGLKQLKDLGLTVRDKSGKLVTVDDPRLDPIWEECGRLGIPVSIHTSDPEASFTHWITRMSVTKNSPSIQTGAFTARSSLRKRHSWRLGIVCLRSIRTQPLSRYIWRTGRRTWTMCPVCSILCPT